MTTPFQRNSPTDRRSVSNGQPDVDADRLIEWFGNHERIAVAFSGGVDSSVVLAAAAKGCSGDVVAVTAKSPSVAAWQLDLAATIAEAIGVEHRFVETDEIDSPDYRANDGSRCFHCKRTLYRTLDQVLRAAQTGDWDTGLSEPGVSSISPYVIVSGTNADDLGDYRPGIAAGDQLGIRKPLCDLGFGKSAVRKIAQHFRLANAELPASPCLASRIAYGVEVTPERLKRVELAEDFLRRIGLKEFRVRLHDGELARIEVPVDGIASLAEETVRSSLIETLTGLGFRFVTIDLQGFSSGSMNRQLVSIESPAFSNPAFPSKSPNPMKTEAAAKITRPGIMHD